MKDLELRLNNQIFDVKYSKSNSLHIAVNDKIYSIEMLKKIGTNLYYISVNQKLMQVQYDIEKNGDMTVSLDGFSYSAEIVNSTRELLSKFIKEHDLDNETGQTVIVSPMPGMVIKTFVEKGSKVQKGDKLIIIEAMKMENVLKSPVDGIIDTIEAKEGTPVNKNEVVIIIKFE